VVTAPHPLFLAAIAGLADINSITIPKTNTLDLFFTKTIITLIMSIKQILIIVILAVAVGGVATVIIFSQNKSNPPSVSQISPSPTPTPVTLSTWTDPAGFSFQYPDSINIDQHPEDNDNYSHLTLTDGQQTGHINIIMADDTYKSLTKWISANPNLKAGNVIDTTLGGLEGKKVITDQGTIIGVIDNGVLVTLSQNAPLSPLLATTWDKITDTWEFIYPTPAPAKSTRPATSDDSGDVLEEE